MPHSSTQPPSDTDMNFIYRLFVIALGVSLASCGGALETTNIDYDRLMYGALTTFTISGPALDKGITLSSTACPLPKQGTEGSSTHQTFTCTITKTGPATVYVVGGNVILHKIDINVLVPQVTVKTSLGDMVLELDPIKAPITALNFMKYVNTSYYNNLIFHRVIPSFVVQGGGYDANMVGPNTLAPIKLEVGNGLSNLRGTLAMARLDTVDSATSQFYINTVDNTSLDTLNGGYAVFGKVISGMDTVDAISAVPTTTTNGMTDVPVTPVVMTSVVQTQ